MTSEQLCQLLGGTGDELLCQCMEYRPKKRLIRPLLTAAALALVVFSTACALSPGFREAVVSVLFPLYSQNQLEDIGKGHLTGSFDEDDVIMTFLSHLEKDEGLDIKAPGGYDYSIYELSDTLHEVWVYAENGGIIILTVENIPYGDTTGLWQVTGYTLQ